MKKKKIYFFVCLLVIIVSLFALNNTNIFKATTDSAEEIFNVTSSKYNLDKVDVSIVRFYSVTGASWHVEKSTEKELENKVVCLSSVLYPRQLKVNRDFELDYLAKYVIVKKKTDKYTEIATENIEILYPIKYIITDYQYATDVDEYFKIKDLSWEGKLNSLISIFVPKYRIHY